MTTPWYEKSFGSLYLQLYAHRSAEEAQKQIESMIKLIEPDTSGPALDLCCGAGRHLPALRSCGFTELVGIDLSEDLLAVARETTSSLGDVVIKQGDMREIPYTNHFSTVVSLFTSFGYFSDDEENYRVIDSIYRSLKTAGKFLMDYLNKDYVIANLVAEDRKESQGNHFHNRRWITDDGKRVEKETVVTMSTGEEHTFNESVRMYSDAEMLMMLERAGFTHSTIYGTLSGESLTSECDRMIICAQK